MADTSCSKLFKPLPPYQLFIIDKLGIPTERTTIEEILKREKRYVQQMTKIQNDNIKIPAPTSEFSTIKTFQEFKRFVLLKNGADVA